MFLGWIRIWVTKLEVSETAVKGEYPNSLGILRIPNKTIDNANNQDSLLATKAVFKVLSSKFFLDYKQFAFYGILGTLLDR